MNNTYLSKEDKREIIKEKHNVYVKPVSINTKLKFIIYCMLQWSYKKII